MWVVLDAASRPGTVAVFGCFASDAKWSLVAQDRELHATPGGAMQPFDWATFVRI